MFVCLFVCFDRESLLKMLLGQKNSNFPNVVIFLSLCFVPQCSVIFTKGTMFVCLFVLIKSLY